MAIRIVGVDIPQNKCGEVSLTYIYGIGRSSAKKILAEAGIDPSIKVENWTGIGRMTKQLKSVRSSVLNSK